MRKKDKNNLHKYDRMKIIMLCRENDKSMLERIFFCVYRVGHTLVSISIYKMIWKSILGIAENAEIMCSVKCSTQSIF